MLVSSIVRFNAQNTMNNASFAAMQTSAAIINTLSNLHTFSGEQKLNELNGLDKNLSINLQLANMQAEMVEQSKNSLNVLA